MNKTCPHGEQFVACDKCDRDEARAEIASLESKLHEETLRVEGGDAIRRGMQEKIDALESRLDSAIAERDESRNARAKTASDNLALMRKLDALEIYLSDHHGIDAADVIAAYNKETAVERHDPFSVPCPFCMAKAGEECDGTQMDMETGKMVKLPRPYCHSQRV